MGEEQSVTEVPVEKVGLVCHRCGYGKAEMGAWVPRKAVPKECPNCKSRKWAKAREGQ